MRVYNRALLPEEAAVLSILQNINEIAAIPREQRSPAQANKLAYYFLDDHSPDAIWLAWQELNDLKRKRELFYQDIPTVMVMNEREKPRDTFV